VSLLPGPRFNVIHGDNGQGKSNLLEALCYLSALRSFRGAPTSELIQEGADGAALEAQVTGEAAPRHYRVRLSRGSSRRVEVDGKRPRSIASYVSSFQVVLFHPGDMQLVSGSPELRRGFLDRVLEQYDPTYGSALSAYTKALRSRNRLLKADRPDRGAITAYDELLASAGAVVGQARERLVRELSPLVVKAFQDISGEGLSLSLGYVPRVAPEVEDIRRALRESLDKDLARGFTADGPHGDDLAFALDQSAAKHFGSQGQHRAIVLAMKVAELYELEQRVGRVPILLLDDVSSELDRSRNRRLFSLLSELGGQVFLTTTHPEFILLERDRQDFHVQAGVITPA
jgi:DNA replication and repair protein RecF